MRVIVIIFSLFLLWGFQTAAQLPAAAPPNPVKAGKPDTLVNVMEKAGVFEIFLSAIREVGMEERLNKEGPFTILAPRDAAFYHVESIARDKLFSNKVLLRKFVEQHVLVGDLNLVDLGAIDSLLTLDGVAVIVEYKEPIEIGRAKVIRSDIRAGNGVIFMLGRAVMAQ